MSDDPIRTFILTHVIRNSTTELTDDTRLIQDGLLNSIGITKIVAFLSDTLGCTLEEDDYKSGNFETLATIRRLYERRSVAAAMTDRSSTN